MFYVFSEFVCTQHTCTFRLQLFGKYTPIHIDQYKCVKWFIHALFIDDIRFIEKLTNRAVVVVIKPDKILHIKNSKFSLTILMANFDCKIITFLLIKV